MFAGVYRECLKVGLTPREVDELELWEVAVALGADQADADPHALLRARVAHAQGQAPKPEARVMSREEFETLTQALGSGSV